MNERERQQLELIAKHELGVVQRALDERIDAIFADHAAHGRLHSGATVKVSIRDMEDIADAFLRDLSSKLKAVAVNSEAFETLSSTVGEFLNICLERQMPPVTQMACERFQGRHDESVQQAAQALFERMRENVERALAIAAFEFEPGKAPPVSAPSLSPATVPKKGGRPPSEFWDDMWAAIAVALYDGTLKPKTQADVERAMADWITTNEYSAADSTIRARARRLWDRLSVPDL